jgi:hypothetical protein
MTAALDILLDEVIEEYNIDTDRVYLSGFSMGGYGAWYLAVHHPEKFAAVFPVAGTYGDHSVCFQGNYSLTQNCRVPAGGLDDVKVLRNMPIRIYLGLKDWAVLPGCTRAAHNALIDGNPDNKAELIELNEEHMGLMKTFQQNMFYDWLLTHKKSGIKPPLEPNDSFPALKPEIIDLTSGEVAYAEATGANGRDTALAAMRGFVEDNGLDETYYVVWLLPDDKWEVQVPLGDKTVTETTTVKTRNFAGGLYAVGAGSNTADLIQINAKLPAWLLSTDYEANLGGSRYLLEEVTYTGSEAAYRLFFPVKEREP